MKRKKILFHINSLGKGGAERVVTVLSGCFAQDGYEVVLVTLWRAGEEYEISEQVKRINLGDRKEVGQGSGKGLALRRLADLRRTMKQERPDIVISFCVKANFRSACCMAGMRTPLLVSVRNNPREDYAGHRVVTKWMEKKAAGCVFQTQEAKEFFSLPFQRRSRIIWNPVDERYLSDRPSKERDDGNITKSNRIVTVGRISRQKNQMLLLRAFNRIREEFPDVKVEIYGEEGEHALRRQMDAYILENGMESQVAFMGHCSRLEKEISDAAVFVLPSDYEGMPNALIEAMVMGLPVIATDCPCGGASALIEHGISGFLVPVGDDRKLAEWMRKLLTDRDLAERTARKAREVADKVSPRKIYGEWKEYVEELIRRP